MNKEIKLKVYIVIVKEKMGDNIKERICHICSGYYLCEKCNTFTSTKYNPEYLKLVHSLGKILNDFSFENVHAIEFVTETLDTMVIFKQIMTMFCNISPVCYNEISK